MKLFLLAIVILAFAVAGIAIKMLVKKDGEFRKSCSHADTKDGKTTNCVCGGSDDDPKKCVNYSKHHLNDEEQ
ncbi:MAG: hypothetical protein PHR81_01120 [Bacteroidales bacterium]|jgi:hypothetical protein|nr:hypothetical protein [Bacteroidales bacterium]MDD4213391.1 hypothetical protein [Bacteroidales bacterium]